MPDNFNHAFPPRGDVPFTLEQNSGGDYNTMGIIYHPAKGPIPFWANFSGGVDPDSLGTAAFVDTGVDPGQIAVLGDDGKLPESVIPVISFTEVITVPSADTMQQIIDFINTGTYDASPSQGDIVTVADGGMAGNYVITITQKKGDYIVGDITPLHTPTGSIATIVINGKTYTPTNGVLTLPNVINEFEVEDGLEISFNTVNGIQKATLKLSQNLKIVTSLEIWVDVNSTKNSEDGSLYFPYKTIQAAINAAPFGSNIKVAPGEYREVLLVSRKENITIIADAAINQYRVKIEGDILFINNPNRIGLSGLSVAGNIIKQTGGSLYATNCDFNSLVLSTSEYFEGRNIYLSGSETSLISGSGDVLLYNSRCDDNHILKTSNIGTYFPSVILSACENFTLEHEAGYVLVTNNTNFVQTDNSFAIDSSCPVGRGGLFLLGGTTYNGFSYGKINKTGTCQYSIANFIHEPKIDVFNGTRIDAGYHSEDGYHHTTPVNYTRENETLSATFIGIDNKLGSVALKTDLSEFKQQVTKYIEVDCNYTGTIEDGSKDHPFKTLDKALDNYSTGCVYHLTPGTYGTGGTLTINNKSNFSIVGEPGLFPRVIVNYNIITSGTSSLVCFKDLSIASISQQGNGMITYKDCAISSLIHTINTARSYCYFVSMEGDFTILGHGYFESCQGSSLSSVIVKTGTSMARNVTMIDCHGMVLDHQSGNIIAYNTWFIPHDETGVSISSVVNIGNGSLCLQNGSTYDFYNKTFGKINKTGTCEYVISGFIYDFVNDTINGSRLDVMESSNDISHQINPVNYERTSSKLSDTLVGIDNKLGSAIPRKKIQLYTSGTSSTATYIFSSSDINNNYFAKIEGDSVTSFTLPAIDLTESGEIWVDLVLVDADYIALDWGVTRWYDDPIVLTTGIWQIGFIPVLSYDTVTGTISAVWSVGGTKITDM